MIRINGRTGEMFIQLITICILTIGLKLFFDYIFNADRMEAYLKQMNKIEDHGSSMLRNPVIIVNLFVLIFATSRADEHVFNELINKVQITIVIFLNHCCFCLFLCCFMGHIFCILY